jgi:DNA-binding transcriptional LysR family regulator
LLQRIQDIPSLKRLRAFDMVGATGSAMMASTRLRISQPAVSYSLDGLEAELGVQLLERGSSGCFLTPQGEVFRRRTSRLFEQLSMAIAEATGSMPAEAALWKIRETQIRALIAIWRAGGFRAAAHDLGIAEPSLQRPARDLERLLRISLYRRTANGFEATGAGAELARRLSLAMGEVWSGIQEIDAIGASARTHLRIGVLALSARTMLAEVSGALLAHQPRQKVEVIEGSWDQHAAALRQGNIDVIFGALRLPSAFDDLNEEALYEDPYALVCRAGHPLLAKEHITPADLETFEFVLPTQGLPRRLVLDALLARWKISPRAPVETSCLSTIVALLRTADRISLLSRWHVELDGWSGLRCLDRVGVPHNARLVGLTTRAGWLPTPFQQEFLGLMRAAAINGSAKRDK